MKGDLRGYLLALASGALFGMVPMVIIGLTRVEAVPSSLCLFFRMAFSSLSLMPFALPRLKRYPITKAVLKKTVPASLLLSVTSVLLYTAYNYIPSGIGVTLHYMYPLVVMVLSAVLFRMRFNKPTIVAMLMSLCGVVLLCDAAVLPEGAATGVILALTSSVTFSGYLLWTDHQKEGSTDPLIFNMLMCGCNAFWIGLYNAAIGRFTLRISPRSYLILLAAGVIAMLAFVTLAMALNLVGSVYTSILGTLEPIVCTIGSALVLHDRISGRTLLGSAVVIAAVIIVTTANRGKPETASEEVANEQFA